MICKTFSLNDAKEFLKLSREYLELDPVANNLILTLVNERIRHPLPGRYWIIRKDKAIVGCAIQSPLDLYLNITMMDQDAIISLTESVSKEKIVLPGVTGEANSSAFFAGKWTEYNNIGANPHNALRIYEIEALNQTSWANGQLSEATMNNAVLITQWMEQFCQEIGEEAPDIKTLVERRIAEGRFFLWEDKKPVALLCKSGSIAGIVRFQILFTPFKERNKGYSSALVYQLARDSIHSGLRIIAYTDLKNPVSNYLFRRIGFRSKYEILKYKLNY